MTLRDFQIPKVGDVLVSTHWRTQERTVHLVVLVDDKLVWYVSGATDPVLPINFFHISNYSQYVMTGHMLRMR